MRGNHDPRHSAMQGDSLAQGSKVKHAHPRNPAPGLTRGR